MHSRKKICAFGVALTFALVPLIAQAEMKINSGFNFVSPQQDVEIGRQSGARVRPAASDALGSCRPGPKFQYHFEVVNQSDLNAFALPGRPRLAESRVESFSPEN